MGNTNLSRAIQTCSSPKNPGQSCGARTRRGTACQKPPLAGKTRGRLHGGRSTGPKTLKGKARIAASHWKHGRRSRAFTEVRKQIWADLCAIEASGAQYAGHFENGQPSGKGQYIDAEGNIYSGRFEDGKPSGHASVEYANGEKYSGYLANGKRHGYGTIRRLDRSTYQGRFRHDLYHGQGSLLKQDGTILEGIWRHGEFQFARKRGGTIRRRESITAPDVRYFVNRPLLIDLTKEGEPTVPSNQDLLFAEVYSDGPTSDEPILVFDQYEYSHLILEAVLDMDEDGYSEVILRAQTGGTVLTVWTTFFCHTEAVGTLN